MRGIVLSVFVIAFFTGCLSAPAPILSGSAGTSGGSGPGSAGDTGTGGITSGSAGATGSAGMMEGTGGNASGAAGTGGTDTGTGGTATGSGGSGGTAGSGGSSTGDAGGAAGTAGTTGRGGTTGTGGVAGTTGRGGTTGAGGMAGAAGRGGVGGTVGPGGTTGTAGATGAGGTASACAPVDGLRVDDPCGSLLSGNACLHKGKTTDDGTPFSAMKAVTMGGTTGTTYQVKIHFRGVTEPTHIMSGTPGTPANFLTGGTRYPDGSQESTYQQWRLTTTNPNQHYYLIFFRAVKPKKLPTKPLWTRDVVNEQTSPFAVPLARHIPRSWLDVSVKLVQTRLPFIAGGTPPLAWIVSSEKCGCASPNS